MPIQEQNIVFVESQVMDDVPEGGGAATGRVIEDGRMNNVFEDISDLDRAYGRFNLRKIFLAVRTLSTDLYGGAKTVVTALPQDAALGYTLFANADPFDTRKDAADKVESYLYKSVTWPGYLLENHIAGMRAISVLQRAGSQLPPIGKTLCIVQDEGLAGEREQYVRVTKVEVATRTFSDDLYANDREFERWVVTMTLSDALRTDFAGHTPRYHDTSYTYAGKARIRDTTVADAARYYGAQRLAAPAAIGDLAVRASSVFTPLVPSAQTETPLSNRALNPSLTVTLSAGTREVEIAQQAHTLARNVTAESRRLTWVENLQPIPAPGALSISYRAQGSWYELTDDGAGAVTGTDPTIGAGTIDYVTGALTLTLGALPDVGSQIMWAWGSPVHYTSLVPTAPAGAAVVIEAPKLTDPIVAGTLTVTWQSGGVEKTATDNGSGAFTGDGTGTINYAAPRIELVPGAPIDPGTSLSLAFTKGVLGDGTPSGNSFDAGEAISPRSVVAWITMLLPDNTPSDVLLWDDGFGNLRNWQNTADFYHLGVGAYGFLGSQQFGEVDYVNGVITVDATAQLHKRVWVPAQSLGTGVYVPAHWDVVSAGSIAIFLDDTPRVVLDDGGAGAATATVPFGDTPENSPTFNINKEIDIGLVPNSLEFTYGGKTYQDRSGTLYADIDPVTGSGIVAGTVNYTTREARITFFAPGAYGAPVITSALGVYGQWTAVDAAFRTAQAPVKPEALSITADTAGAATGGVSELIAGAADEDGVISGSKMRGQINYEMGTAWVEFGEMVGEEWSPIPVQTDTIRYNAVAYSYLPLDADILGIDPVRLPSDGRVPIYRPGDVVMVMHTAETDPATVINDGTIDCGRTRIGWVRVIDATGASKPTGFTLDRATGIVTFTDVSDMTMPVKVRHTVGDLRQITDVQITGQLTLARPLTHDYPAEESIVASCLIHGDRRARVSSVWDQATWNGTWSDSLVGSEATATLDVIAHPIEVTNEGAETERWLLRWTSTTSVELIGQRRGLVYSGPFTADIAPINPRTRNPDGTGGVPYLRIPLAANGGGWSAGNVVRINTVGALADIWIARSIQQSDEPLGDGEDGVELYALGNIDRP